MKLSALICVHERPAHLRACLRALSFQTHPPDEIIVVDDGSTPVAAERISLAVRDMRGLPIRLVRRERTAYCPAAARNAAIRQSVHPYLLFLDCDILPFPDVVGRHIERAKPGQFLIGNCAMLDAEGSSRFLGHTDWTVPDLESAWDAADRRPLEQAARRYRWHALERRLGLARRHRPKLLSGHFSIFRESVLAVNGFDERYTGWGYEDDDLGMRLYMAGCRSHPVITTARTLHLHHPSAKPSTGRTPRPNRAYFRRRRVAVRCTFGIDRPDADQAG